MKKVITLLLLILLSSCDNVTDKVEIDFSLELNTIEKGTANIDWSTKIKSMSGDDLSFTELEDNIDYNKIGTYLVTIEARGKSNNKMEKTFRITVIDTSVIEFDIGETTIEAGRTDIDWSKKINIISDHILVFEVIGDTVDYDTPGQYQVTIKATSDDEKFSYETFEICIVDTTGPMFEIESQKFSVGSKTTLEAYVTNISDNSDTPLKYSEDSTTIDYNRAGNYNVVVRITDEAGNYTEKIVPVTITDTLFDMLNRESFMVYTIPKEVYKNTYEYYGINLDGFYTITTPQGEKGIIYQVNDSTDRERLFIESKDKSFLINDIMFVYQIENYVIEIHHNTTSTFPYLLDYEDFAANYQYYYFYTDELNIHPFVEYLVNNSSEFEIMTREYLNEFPNIFVQGDIYLNNVTRLTSKNGWTGSVIEFLTIEDAVYAYEEDLFFHQNTASIDTIILIHQNIIIKASFTVGFDVNVYNSLPEGIVYLSFSN